MTIMIQNKDFPGVFHTVGILPLISAAGSNIIIMAHLKSQPDIKPAGNDIDPGLACFPS